MEVLTSRLAECNYGSFIISHTVLAFLAKIHLEKGKQIQVFQELVYNHGMYLIHSDIVSSNHHHQTLSLHKPLSLNLFPFVCCWYIQPQILVPTPSSCLPTTYKAFLNLSSIYFTLSLFDSLFPFIHTCLPLALWVLFIPPLYFTFLLLLAQ